MEPSDRFILFTAQKVSESYISRRLGDMRLFRQDNLYTLIPCVEMESIDVFKCDIVEFKSCDKLMRSTCKLPSLAYSKLGNTVKEVTAIDNKYLFQPNTLAQYRRDSKRKKRFSKNTKYFYVRDGYLYIPDTEVETVNLYLLSLDLYDSNGICSCSEDCKSAWDYEFIAPSDLLDQILKEAASQIQISVQIQPDETANLNANIKN